MGFGKRVCRLINYGVTGTFMFAGLIFFILGISFVASYTGNAPSFQSNADVAGGLVIEGETPAPSARTNASQDVEAIYNLASNVPVYLWFPILWGIIVMLVAGVGCCGIKMYSRLVLGIYVVMVVVVFFVQLIVGLVFTTMYQADLLLLKESENERFHDEVEQGSSSIVTSFFVVLFLEVGVMVTAACLRNQLTGDEKEEKKAKKLGKLEDDIVQREADREKRKNQFEMQSRRMAEKIQKKGKSMFG
mmetsp:Transcript_20616/g.51606  ORF Transcript_20616/g.51606 Transcript_20616/m.51606 type:complete len:247 (-) Transcript_20616:226-966(-)